MAILLVEQNGRRRGGVLRGRVVIGRGIENQIVIREPNVSRLHAWIGLSDEGYYVADTGARSGTRVNGMTIDGRRLLKDGDRIQIGPATLSFYNSEVLPAGVQPMDLSHRPDPSGNGIFVDCRCGAPLWAPWDFAGRAGRCQYCGQVLQLPAKPSSLNPSETPEETTSATAPPDETSTCGACQSPIAADEQSLRCPDCGVKFHADCWVENRGCSSYGCKQVAILEPRILEAQGPVDHAPSSGPDDEATPEPDAVRWEFLLLPASLAAGLLGMFTFGIPALALAVSLVMWQRRHRTRHRGLLAISLLIALPAILAGALFSWYWWMGNPLGALRR